MSQLHEYKGNKGEIGEEGREGGREWIG